MSKDWLTFGRKSLRLSTYHENHTCHEKLLYVCSNGSFSEELIDIFAAPLKIKYRYVRGLSAPHRGNIWALHPAALGSILDFIDILMLQEFFDSTKLIALTVKALYFFEPV